MKQYIRKTCVAAFAVAVSILPLSTAQPVLKNADRYAALTRDITNNIDIDDFAYRNADALRYPASLTKLMTLHIVFNALDLGQITLETECTVSTKAAVQPPSKLGLRAGSTITIEQLILANAIKSANDSSVAIAECVAGSEEGFVDWMNERAEELGMASTHYENTHGLPDAQQVTTARDQVKLLEHMIENQPHYMDYLSRKTFRYGGRTFKTHNYLVKDHDFDLGKTGYIRAAGFHVIIGEVRDGVTYVSILMGGEKGRSRDETFRENFDMAMKSHAPILLAMDKERTTELNMAALDPAKGDDVRLTRYTNDEAEMATAQGSADAAIDESVSVKDVRRNPENLPSRGRQASALDLK